MCGCVCVCANNREMAAVTWLSAAASLTSSESESSPASMQPKFSCCRTSSSLNPSSSSARLPSSLGAVGSISNVAPSPVRRWRRSKPSLRVTERLSGCRKARARTVQKPRYVERTAPCVPVCVVCVFLSLHLTFHSSS